MANPPDKYPPQAGQGTAAAGRRLGGDGWGMGQDRAEVARFLTGHAPVDKRGLMALAKEIGKNLAEFKAPEGFVPKAPVPEGTLPPVAAKAMGAQTLKGFFARLPSPPGQSPDPYPPMANLPKGLDDLDWAIKVVDAEYDRLSRAAQIDPRRQSRRRTELVTTKAALIKARQMGEQFWAMFGEWSDESRATYREAQELAESIKRFMNASGATAGAEGGPGQGGAYAGGAYGGGQGSNFAGGEIRDRSLTADAAKLSERLRDIRDVFNRRLNWQSGLRALRGEIETLTATASADGAALANRDRYWAPTIKSLHARLVALEKAHREIGQATEAGRREVAEALEALEEDERILLGETGTDLKKRSELLSMKVETLNRNALSLCQEIKDFWRILPSLVGKSRQLEKFITSI
ncbi:MAG: hypothetical protein LBJ61_10150, partial [Deltaproteobacteria bacterium]|nr:hypothetical protein [Deltaproteobacteria bacterium]